MGTGDTGSTAAPRLLRGPRGLTRLSAPLRSALHQPTSHRPRLLLTGRCGSGQSSHLAPALLHALERFTVYTLDMAVLYGVSSTSPEEACAQVLRPPVPLPRTRPIPPHTHPVPPRMHPYYLERIRLSFTPHVPGISLYTPLTTITAFSHRPKPITL